MLTLKEDSSIIGITELRNKTSIVLNEIKKNKVILTKRNKPVGIIIDYNDYEKMLRIIDEVEDIVLGGIAMERIKRKDRKAIPLEEAEKIIGLR
jgi:prevent-host-death family protein